MSMASTTSPVTTVWFVDDSADEYFLADFSFRKERIGLDLEHFEAFDSFAAHLGELSETELHTSIAVIDLNLTVSKGSDGIAQLRRKDRYQGMILGVCSGSDDPAGRQSCLEAGADFFVAKPLNRKALLTMADQVPSLHQNDAEDGDLGFIRDDYSPPK